MYSTESIMMNFGIIIEASSLEEWQYKIIQHIHQKQATLTVVIDVAKPATSRVPPSGFLHKIWMKHATKKLTSRPVNFLALSASENYRVISSTAEPTSVTGYQLDEAALSAIRDLKLDFILHFGDDAISGDILDAAKHGVWRFHHGDGREYRGQPACFWEMYNRENEIGGVLQRLTATAGTEIVLQRFSVARNKHSWSANINAIREASIAAVGGALVDINNGTLDPGKSAGGDTRRDERALPENTFPDNMDMLRFFYGIALSIVSHISKRLFFTHHWQVAVCNASVDEILTRGIRKIHVLGSGNISSFFYADPFVLAEHGNTTELLVEKYDWKMRKGLLKRINVSMRDGKFVTTAEYPLLEASNHLSYPLVVRSEGKTFMIPESGKARCIALHEIDDNATIVNSSTIIDNAELVDPTVLYHNEKYWLFASNRKGELYIWHSNELQRGWEPHARQPVLTSPSASRGAGNFFVHNNQLIRPTQDCSESYGKQVLFNRITALDESTFSQELVGIIPPVIAGVRYDGLHTFNAGDGKVFLDIRTLHLDPLKPVKFLLRAIRKRIRTPVPHPPLAMEPRRKATALDD